MSTRVDLRDATLTIGGVTAKIADGTLTIEQARNIEYVLDRRQLDDVRQGDDVPLTVDMSIRWLYSNGSLRTAIDGNGGETSSDSSPCRPYACDLVLALDPSCSSLGQSVEISDFRYENITFDAPNGVMRVRGRANVTTPVFGSE